MRTNVWSLARRWKWLSAVSDYNLEDLVTHQSLAKRLRNAASSFHTPLALLSPDNTPLHSLSLTGSIIKYRPSQNWRRKSWPRHNTEIKWKEAKFCVAHTVVIQHGANSTKIMLNRTRIQLLFSVCVSRGASASTAVCAYIPRQQIKPDGVTETCMADQHAHMQKGGHGYTNDRNYQDTTTRITIHKAAFSTAWQYTGA
jgi:hypothetical protein